MAEQEPNPNYCTHEPDWDSLLVTEDGGDTYIDIVCAKCGITGCLGNREQLIEGVTWEI
jgi:hypothetical protein